MPEGTEMVMPGDNVTITVELIYPVALNVGLRFAIREEMCIRDRLPMRIALTSPRNTALNQMLQSFPITTSPIIVALSAK